MTPEIQLRHDFSSPAERVFAALDDHANMGRWLGSRTTLAKRADDGGVGTVRRIHAGFAHLDEEIIEREAPRRIVYRIVSRLPGISFHRGEVTVEPSGQGAAVRWRVQLDSPVPGLARLMLEVVGFALRRGLARLARQLEG